MWYFRFFVWIVGIITFSMGVYLILYFSVLRKTFSLPPQSLSEYIPAISPTINREEVSPGKTRPFFYQNRQVKLVEGSYQKIQLGERLLVVRIDGKDKLFSLTKDTKLVCQPSGFLNIETSSNQAIPANDVYIEDKREGNFGIPWGAEISPDRIMARVTPKTMVQLFVADTGMSFIPIPKLAYVWFEKC